MHTWTIKPLYLGILLGMLFLIVAILVLPDVDLPDAAFQSGTAPAVLQARSIAVPNIATVTSSTPFIQSGNLFAPQDVVPALRPHLCNDSLPILHRALRC